MPSLQIRDVPEDLYSRYKQQCAQEGRSMAQQTLLLIKHYLASVANDGTSPTSNTEAMPIAVPHATRHIAPERSSWETSVYNPMVDIIGREERIAARKALFKYLDEQDFSSLEPPPGYSSFAEMIREDRDNDHGHIYPWEKSR